MRTLLLACLLCLLSVPVAAQQSAPEPFVTLAVTPTATGYSAEVCGRLPGKPPVCVAVTVPEALTPDQIVPEPEPQPDPEPVPPPTLPPTSPDGTRALSIVDADHHVWTIQAPDGVPLRDGVSMPGYGVASYCFDAGTVYIVTTADSWYAWSGTAWMPGRPRQVP